MSSTTSSGLRAWLLQRLSAVYMAVFIPVFLVIWIGEPATYEAWRNFVAHPVVNLSLILFIFATIVHAWVGIRDIIMDYIHPVLIRYLVLICFGLVFAGISIWSLRILIMVTPV